MRLNAWRAVAAGTAALLMATMANAAPSTPSSTDTLTAQPVSVQSKPTQPTPAEPSSAQPTLPQPLATRPSLLLVETPKLGTSGRNTRRRRIVRRHRHRYDEPLERPALAGVELLAPIPHPRQPPHLTVPVPAYPLENLATFYTTPPPPVVCHPARRDPDAPDPHLLRERTVVCEADNP